MLHHQYETVIKALNITPVWIKPVVGTLNSLSDSDKSTNAELFIYINDQSTMLCHAYGSKITRMDNFKELGLEKLYAAISEELGLETNYVKQILNTTWSFGNNLKSVELINGFDLNRSSIEKIDGNTISKYIESFARSIVDCKNNCLKFVKEKKGIEFKKITFVPKDTLTGKIINLTQIHNDSKTGTYTQNEFIDGDESYNQLALAINNIIKLEETNDDNTNCIDTTTGKSIIGFIKGE